MNQLKKDRIVIGLNQGLYSAEIFNHNRSFEYESMCCGKCNHKIFTEFYADLILHITEYLNSVSRNT